MSPGKGTMLIFNQRMTDTVVNRLKRPGDGDIMVPVHTRRDPRHDRGGGRRPGRLGDPARGGGRAPRRGREALPGPAADAAAPGLRRRPAALPAEPSATGEAEDGRAISRAHVVIDHGRRDGVDNLVSIVGGKLTTYRLMAKQTADVVVRKLGLRRSVHDGPGAAARRRATGRTYWLGAPVRGARGGRRRRCRPRLRVRAGDPARRSTRSSTRAGRARSTTSAAARGWAWARARAASARSARRASWRSVRVATSAADDRDALDATSRTSSRSVPGGTRPIALGPPAPGAVADGRAYTGRPGRERCGRRRRRAGRAVAGATQRCRRLTSSSSAPAWPG